MSINTKTLALLTRAFLADPSKKTAYLLTNEFKELLEVCLLKASYPHWSSFAALQ